MEGVIFIRTLTQEQEMVLENFKKDKSITANTKAIQAIIMEYERLKKSENVLKNQIHKIENENLELKYELEDYAQFFNMFKKLTKTKKKVD